MLAYELLGSPLAPKTLLFLHGMLGRRTNLRSFAQRFVWGSETNALLVDHRGHGDSHGFPAPHTVLACSEDCLKLTEHLVNSGGIQAMPKAVVGHSFGGKVALGVRELIPEVKTTWVLDSSPGRQSRVDMADSKDSVYRLVERLGEGKGWESKADVVRMVKGEWGFSNSVAMWMTTNVKGKGEWAFDLKVCEELLEDYCKADFFPRLKNEGRRDQKVYFLRAGRNNSVWTSEVLNRFETEVDGDLIKLITMNDVGHFLHAEKPDEVFSIMLPSLKEE